MTLSGIAFASLACWHRCISIYFIVKYLRKIHIHNHISANCDYLCLWNIISVVAITEHYNLIICFLCNMPNMIFILSSNTFVKEGLWIFLFICS
jgi:hypothetical protein